MIRPVVLAAAITLSAAPAIAQPLARPATFDGLLDGDLPLAVRLGDLDSDWRQLRVLSETGGFENLISAALASFIGSDRGLYLTEGQTVTISGETYLVAYSFLPPEAEFDLDSIFSGVECQQASLASSGVLTPDSELSLALLNLRTIGSFSNIEVFDADALIARSEAAYQRQLDACQERQPSPEAPGTEPFDPSAPGP